MGFKRLQYSGKSYLLFKLNDYSYDQAVQNISAPLLKEYDETLSKDNQYKRRLLIEAYNNAISELQHRLIKVNSLNFYMAILLGHEASIEAYYEIFKSDEDSFSDDFSYEDFVLFRRVYKLVLEFSTKQCLKTYKEKNEPLRQLKAIEGTLDEIFALGVLCFEYSSFIAELNFTPDNLLIECSSNEIRFIREREFENEIRDILRTQERLPTNPANDDGGYTELVKLLNEAFGVNVEKFRQALLEFRAYHKKYHLETEVMSILLVSLGASESGAKSFLDGLTLNKSSSLPFEEVPIRPKNLNRYFYRPILEWDIDGTKKHVVSLVKFDESFHQLHLDTIPWGKVPEQWESSQFIVDYKNRKSDEHESWLNDMVEQNLKDCDELIFQRSVTTVRGTTKYLNLDEEGCGEIDFLILNKAASRIFLVECKYFQLATDMVSYRNDLSRFTNVEDGYNLQLKAKLTWAEQNISNLNFHIQSELIPEIDLSGFCIQPVFIIATPTFYQYCNPEFPIITIHDCRTYFLDGTIPFLPELNA